MATGFMEPRYAFRRRVRPILLALLGMVCARTALGLEIQVVGLFSGKAMVSIDGGKPRMMAVGESVAGKAKLLSATSEAAVFEVDGRRQTLTVGGQAISNTFKSAGRPTVTLMADGGGHYSAEGSINGIPVRFLVDTGATMVSLGTSDARRAGIDYLSGVRGYSNTANGPAPVYRVKLNSVKVGPIAMTNVDGLVHESNDMPFVLLGMSFLNRLELKHQGSQLTMVQRF